jgi:hypothetical protein
MSTITYTGNIGTLPHRTFAQVVICAALALGFTAVTTQVVNWAAASSNVSQVQQVQAAAPSELAGTLPTVIVAAAR